jgi:hypothetical protein
MSLLFKIVKKGEQYSAHISPLHVKGPYDSPHPMSAQELYNDLKNHGCNTRDILDELWECDPDWGKDNPDFRT